MNFLIVEKWFADELEPAVAGGGIVAVATDAITFSDSAEAITTRVAAATDTLTVSDSATAITDRVAVATDSVTFSDSAVAGVSLPAVATDTVTFSDSAVAVTTVVATASDSITLSDSAEAITTRVAVAVDSVTLTDSAVAILVPPGGAAAVAEDSITFSDSAVAVYSAVAVFPTFNLSGGGRRWYSIKQKRLYLTNEELVYYLARDLIDAAREDIKVTYKTKPARVVSQNAYESLMAAVRSLENMAPNVGAMQDIASEDDDEEALMLMI